MEYKEVNDMKEKLFYLVSDSQDVEKNIYGDTKKVKYIYTREIRDKLLHLNALLCSQNIKSYVIHKKRDHTEDDVKLINSQMNINNDIIDLIQHDCLIDGNKYIEDLKDINEELEINLSMVEDHLHFLEEMEAN